MSLRLDNCVLLAAMLAAIAVALLIPGPGRAQGRAAFAEPNWGDNIQVTDVPPGPQTRYMNYSVAVDPTNSTTLLSSYDFQYPAAQVTIGYARSTDSGSSWHNHLFDGIWGSGMSPEMNSSVAFDAAGTAYLSGRASSPNLTGYYVLTATHGTVWHNPVPVIISDNSQFRDQASLAVDRRKSGSGAGSIYLTYRYFNLTAQGLQIGYSRDGGSTWTTDITVSDAGNGDDFGPTSVVAADGTVYVAFMEITNNCFRCGYEPKLFLDRSTDAGRTWGQDQLITGEAISHIGALDTKLHEWVISADSNGSPWRVYQYPSLAVAPNDRDTVYVAWNDGRWETPFSYSLNTGKHGDIAFSRSTDAGHTWSSPFRVNDDPVGNGVDQLQPNLAVMADGTLGMTWYDRRYSYTSPNYIYGYYYDLVYSQSTDGGRSWSPNRRISDTSSHPYATTDYKSVGDLGARNPLVFGPDYALATWADGRRGNTLELYSARGPFGAIFQQPLPALKNVLPDITK